MTWDLAKSQGEIHQDLPFPQWERKYLKSQAENKLLWPCDHPNETRQKLQGSEFQNSKRSKACMLVFRKACQTNPLPPSPP